MAGLPKDPYILLSVINMKLRDHYASLDQLCDDLDEDKAEIEAALARINYTYNSDLRTFTKLSPPDRTEN